MARRIGEAVRNQYYARKITAYPEWQRQCEPLVDVDQGQPPVRLLRWTATPPLALDGREHQVTPLTAGTKSLSEARPICRAFSDGTLWSVFLS